MKRETTNQWLLGYAKGFVPALGMFALAIVLALIMAATNCHAGMIPETPYGRGPTSSEFPKGGAAQSDAWGWGGNATAWAFTAYYNASAWFNNGMNNWMAAYQRELIAKRYSY